MENLIKKKYFILPGIALIAFFALYPFESTVVPEWTLEVRDADGDICGNMRVTEHWGHYSLYIDGATQTEDRNTDSLGVVVFPERKIRAIGLRRFVVPIIAHILVIAHGSVGADGAVWSSGLKDVAWHSYKPGKSLPNKMRVEKCISGDS